MPIVISGTTGISGPDGSAGTPAVQGSDANTGVFYPAADTVALSTGGTERVRVDSSGNVGIGVTPSAAWAITALQIKNGSIYGLGNNTGYFANLYYDSGGWKYISSATGSGYEQSSGNHLWFTAASGTAGNAAALTERMRLDNSGNVGIGTSSPGSILHTYGAGQTTAAMSTSTNQGASIKIQDTNGTAGGGGAVVFGAFQGFFAAIKGLITDGTNNTIGAIAFSTRNSTADSTLTERMRIDSGGSFSAVIPSGSTLYPAFWCRAWVNFNGTGTIAIRGSGNVTSLTDNGVGDYTINFTTAMPDTNYAAIHGGSQNAGSAMGRTVSAMNTGSYRLVTRNSNNAGATDDSEVHVAIMR